MYRGSSLMNKVAKHQREEAIRAGRDAVGKQLSTLFEQDELSAPEGNHVLTEEAVVNMVIFCNDERVLRRCLPFIRTGRITEQAEHQLWGHLLGAQEADAAYFEELTRKHGGDMGKAAAEAKKRAIPGTPLHRLVTALDIICSSPSPGSG